MTETPMEQKVTEAELDAGYRALHDVAARLRIEKASLDPEASCHEYLTNLFTVAVPAILEAALSSRAPQARTCPDGSRCYGFCDSDGYCPGSRAPQAGGEGLRYNDRSVPCPTCGFYVREIKRVPFVIEEDDAEVPAGTYIAAHARHEGEPASDPGLTACRDTTSGAYARGINDAANHVLGVPEDETVRCSRAFLITLAASIRALPTPADAPKGGRSYMSTYGLPDPDAPKGDVRGALKLMLAAVEDAQSTFVDGSNEDERWNERLLYAITAAECALSTPSQDEGEAEPTDEELAAVAEEYGLDPLGEFELSRKAKAQDEGEALRSALYLANRDKESILRRLDTDIAGVEARPKSGEINETLRDGALGALRAFRAAIVEYEWTAPREHLTATQKLENIEDAIVDSILAEPAGAEGEARVSDEAHVLIAKNIVENNAEHIAVAALNGLVREIAFALSAAHVAGKKAARPAEGEGEALRREQEYRAAGYVKHADAVLARVADGEALRSELQAARHEGDAQYERAEALRRALEPFAELADAWGSYGDESSVAVSIRHLRRAREVLSRPPEPPAQGGE